MKDTKKIPAVAVVGPTASGKTALAVKLAHRFDGEVISADSMQIFDYMPIASAAATQEEQGGIRHHLIGVLGANESFSVADFVEKATAIAKDINARGKLPVIAGGTGLYVDSLINNVQFCSATPDYELRARLEKEYETLGGEQMLCKLAKLDKTAAEKLHANDKKRIVRAFEVMNTSGKTVTDINEKSLCVPSPFRFCVIGITYRDRQKLYDRINLRTDRMLASGLIEEARAAYNAKNAGTGAQAIGHKELFDYFSGKQSLEEAAEKIKKETRHLAKRQLTWFNRNPNINWIYADDCENTAEEAEKILKNNGFEVK